MQGSLLTDEHNAGLAWFDDRVGVETEWPAPLNGLFLVNKAKGIHKPKGFEHALSVRHSLTGPYFDKFKWTNDGLWTLDYAHEGKDPAYFTNRAMRACLIGRVPVGVIVQIKGKPNSRYRILGLGSVVDDSNGFFTIAKWVKPG